MNALKVNYEPLRDWIKEREAIRLRKELGQSAPFTSDPILSKFRFCNVRRRDDRVSRWIQDRVLALPVPEGSLGLANLGMFLALCRFLNWPPAIQRLLTLKLWPNERPNWEQMGRQIDMLMKGGEKVWTGAYMIRAESNPNAPWFALGKGRYIVEIVVGRELTNAALALRNALRDNTRQAVAEVLGSCYGWGPFMAGQVVDDWSWTPLLADATDHFIWAPQGPGSLRGLNRLKGLPLTTKHDEKSWCADLIELRQQVIDELGHSYDDLTLMDIQNCLCETDKYLRVKHGEGRPRSYYRPETAY